MKIKKIIGYSLIASPFLGIFIFGWINLGLLPIILTYIGVALLILLLHFAIGLTE